MPAPGGADALGEVALRHDLEFDPAGAVERVEMMRIALARERAEDLPHPPFADQQREARLAIAGIVADDREILRAVFDQRVDQFGRLAREAEAADHDDGAVGDALEGVCERMPLVDHDAARTSTPPPFFRLESARAPRKGEGGRIGDLRIEPVTAQAMSISGGRMEGLYGIARPGGRARKIRAHRPPLVSPSCAELKNVRFAGVGAPRRRQADRKGRKKARISAARASGCSRAAKWPPAGISVQRRMS